ncbi:hypothetical protein CLOSTASPAR_02678 [[Clostridium] asparagiforme DSM 15981]|uniref:Undecaprenyl diphosphate synthase n=1 Tax=[Clostridium] asparagiforme DSM 15981 TaxID=518636 RepID=C0D096_9FIRM|nr:hypothetical protein CLOSTASPAR_02678 [[Clostridium] asparagiforme DSM 15981]
MRIPQHIGIIPDGNRRWAVQNGMEKQDGYRHGISPGLSLYRTCRDLGIREMSFYGFTVDNTKRAGPKDTPSPRPAWMPWRPSPRKRPACWCWETPSPPCSRPSSCPTPGATTSAPGA